MQRKFLFALSLVASASAFAGGYGHDPKPPTTTPPPTTTVPVNNALGQGQVGIVKGGTQNLNNKNLSQSRSAAAAAAAANAAAAARSSATGGVATGTGGTAVGGTGGTQNLNVEFGAPQPGFDGYGGNPFNAGRHAGAVEWAPVIHGETAAPLPSGSSIVAVKSECGPRVRIVTNRVIGYFRGFWGGIEEVTLGYSQDVAEDGDENGNPTPMFDIVDGERWGHKYTILADKLSTSSSNSASLGAFLGRDAAQGGMASSGGMQQIGKHIVVSRCLHSLPKPRNTQPPAPGLGFTPMQPPATLPPPRADRS